MVWIDPHHTNVTFLSKSQIAIFLHLFIQNGKYYYASYALSYNGVHCYVVYKTMPRTKSLFVLFTGHPPRGTKMRKKSSDFKCIPTHRENGMVSCAPWQMGQMQIWYADVYLWEIGKERASWDVQMLHRKQIHKYYYEYLGAFPRHSLNLSPFPSVTIIMAYR